jgi:cellulose synthase (UDP-forming)
MAKDRDRGKRFVLMLVTIAMMLGFAYIIIRTFYTFREPHPWYELLLAMLLLSAEAAGLVQSTGYLMTLIHVLKDKDSNIVHKAAPETRSYPPIAVVVPSYKEPLSILKDTLTCFYNLSYPNKRLYLLDDSRYDRPWDTPEKVQAYKKSVEELCQWLGVNLFRRKWRGAKAGIINDFVKFLSGEKPEDLEYHPYQNLKTDEPVKYVAVFDADMNPFPDFLQTLTPYLEENAKTALIQSPQYYSNFETNRVARAAGLQQVVFFEYICEGKGLSDAMFCCGTNVLIRKEALDSVGGFDETSVTEDFATSLQLHKRGWKTLYYNKVLAFGMGPEDLGAYYKQQFRWALGTLTLARKLPGEFISNFRKLSPSAWWEYFLSSTYYMVGWFYLIMFMIPILYLLADIPSFYVDQQVYIFAFFPYLLLTLTMVCWTLYWRNLSSLQFGTSILIGATSFPVLIRALGCAILGVKGSFTVTPKDRNDIMPLYALWPQLTALLLCVIALAWGVQRIYYERDPVYGILANMAWCVYNGLLVGSLFYFNYPDEAEELPA